MKQYQVRLAVAALAASLHQDWRTAFEKQKGVGTPRWKATIDEAWATTADPAIVRGAPGSLEVNINSPFEGLPFDWQADNAAAAQTAVDLVLRAHTSGADVNEPHVIEALAAEVHDAWIARLVAKEVLQAFEKRVPLAEVQATSYERTSGLAVRYAELPEVEKDKDRAHLRLAVKALGL